MRGQILRMGWAAAIIWTLVLAASLFWDIHRNQERIVEAAFGRQRDGEVVVRGESTRRQGGGGGFGFWFN